MVNTTRLLLFIFIRFALVVARRYLRLARPIGGTIALEFLLSLSAFFRVRPILCLERLWFEHPLEQSR